MIKLIPSLFRNCCASAVHRWPPRPSPWVPRVPTALRRRVFGRWTSPEPMKAGRTGLASRRHAGQRWKVQLQEFRREADLVLGYQLFGKCGDFDTVGFCDYSMKWRSVYSLRCKSLCMWQGIETDSFVQMFMVSI